MNGNDSGSFYHEQRQRAIVLLVLMGAVFLVLWGRFFLIQVGQRDHFVRLSNQNRLKAIPLEATRGLILDRTGTVLVDNKATYTVSAIPLKLGAEEEKARITRLAPMLGMSPDKLLLTLRKRKSRSFQPVKLKRNVSFATISQLEENRDKFPGIIYQVEPQREYLFTRDAAHLLGYIGEMTDREYRVMRKKGYLYGELTGRTGIERVYEQYLRGTPGIRYVEVNATGRKVGELKEKYHAPVAGNDLHLTIDIGLQHACEAAMPDSVRGALVVLDPRNGDVLAMVSRPAFDPNIFSGIMTTADWQRLNNADTRPLFNRAVQGQYPPGSVYKMLTAIAGLETGHIDRHTLFRGCTGAHRFGRRIFRCWKASGHGRLDVRESLVQSCDVFFYQLAPLLGLEQWGAYSRRFGFGAQTGIDLTGEMPGLVPVREYYDGKQGRETFAEGELLNLSIGQGALLTTPLQIARYTAAIANNGIMVVPRIMRQVTGPGGKLLLSAGRTRGVSPGVSDASYAIIRQAMMDVTVHPRGTGRACRVPGLAIAGKTGSAENPHGIAHAWFTAFAPAENPELVVTVLLETAGHGGDKAAPVARRVFEYFSRGRGEDRAGL